MEPKSGFLLIPKKEGISSSKLLGKVKWELELGKKTPLGHAGTLDPLASGLIFAAYGYCTSFMQYIELEPKTYEVEIKLGFRSFTDDNEGPIYYHRKLAHPDFLKKRIELFLNEYVTPCKFKQLSPWISAKSSGGKKHYNLARQKGILSRTKKEVLLENIKLLSFLGDTLSLELSCGTGFYVRSIVRELGEYLGTGAFITKLHRSRLGDFKCPENIKSLSIASTIKNLDWEILSESKIQKLSHGQFIKADVRAADTRFWALGEEKLIQCLQSPGQIMPKRVIRAEKNTCKELLNLIKG